MAYRLMPGLPTDVSETTTPKVRVISYGDGYEQVRPDGLNNQLRKWKVSYKQQSYAVVKTLRDFLVSTKGAEAFHFLPPGESVPALVRVDGSFDRNLPHFDKVADFTFSLREVVL